MKALDKLTLELRTEDRTPDDENMPLFMFALRSCCGTMLRTAVDTIMACARQAGYDYSDFAIDYDAVYVDVFRTKDNDLSVSLDVHRCADLLSIAPSTGICADAPTEEVAADVLELLKNWCNGFNGTTVQ